MACAAAPCSRGRVGYGSLGVPSLICSIASHIIGLIYSEPVHLAWGRAGWLAAWGGGASFPFGDRH